MPKSLAPLHENNFFESSYDCVEKDLRFAGGLFSAELRCALRIY